jgi:hypothetical protein
VFIILLLAVENYGEIWRTATERAASIPLATLGVRGLVTLFGLATCRRTPRDKSRGGESGDKSPHSKSVVLHLQLLPPVQGKGASRMLAAR